MVRAQKNLKIIPKNFKFRPPINTPHGLSSFYIKHPTIILEPVASHDRWI
jgi:hypothetical protein